MAKRRVLIVDDDPDVLAALMRGMRDEIDRWDPMFALGGPAGINAVREMDFDLVIADRDMPIEDGDAVLEAARAHRSDAVRVLVTQPFTVEHLRDILAAEREN